MEKIGSKLTSLSDLELIELALKQHQGAFIILYTRYNDGVRAHISHYIKQKEDIEDICIESFQKAFNQISSYNSEYRFSTWLYRIARNTAFDHISKTARKNINLPTTSLNDEYVDGKLVIHIEA